MHMLKHPDHVIAWDKVALLDHDRNFYARRMKESLYIDIFSKTGIMNLADGMQKTNAGMPLCQYWEEISEKIELDSWIY